VFVPYWLSVWGSIHDASILCHLFNVAGSPQPEQSASCELRFQLDLLLALGTTPQTFGMNYSNCSNLTDAYVETSFPFLAHLKDFQLRGQGQKTHIPCPSLSMHQVSYSETLAWSTGLVY
jgi:hypothetical protein